MEFDDKISIEALKILIVDDETVNRKVVRHFLERNKFVVVEAASGPEALQQVENEEPDLVLLDVMMEGMDGFEACRRIKEIPQGKGLPVIFVTSITDTKSIVKGLSEGGADYITKPFKPNEAIARIKAHLQLRALMKKQRHFIDALRKANDTKTKIMGVVSHDLKNPIVSIRGLAQFLVEGLTGDLNEEQMEISKNILEAADTMLFLAEDLMSYTVAHSDEIKVDPRPDNLMEVVTNSVSLWSISADRKQIGISVKNEGIPTDVPIDKRQLRRVVDNLLSNAIKYSPEQSDVTVRLFTDETGKYAVVEVRDEGPGIPEDEIPKLFKAFGTTTVMPTGGEQSTGLGLLICKKIVDAHGGDIGVSRLPEKGTRFWFRLAITPAKPPETAEAPVEDK